MEFFLRFLLALIQCLENQAGKTIMLKVFCTLMLVTKKEHIGAISI